ncbi:MAG: hypothetical protein ACE5ID_05515 [Acidobacteriota bacterium]
MGLETGRWGSRGALLMVLALASGSPGGGPAAVDAPQPPSLTFSLPPDQSPQAPWRDPILSAAFPWPLLLSPRLMRFDGGGRLAGDLAAAASTPDGGRTWLFRLRPERRLLDGSALTAQQFCRLWRRGGRMKAKRRSLSRAIFGDPVPGDQETVVFRLRSPSHLFPRLLAHPAFAVEGIEAEFCLQPARSRGTWTFIPSSPAAPGSLYSVVLQGQDQAIRAFGAGEVDAWPLSEAWMMTLPPPPEVERLCARLPWTYALSFQPRGREALDRRLRQVFMGLIHRRHLVEGVAPATGRPLGAAAGLGGGVPGGETPGDKAAGVDEARLRARSFRLLVDAGDLLAVALADQIQADLVDQEIHLQVEKVAGRRYEARLRQGDYGTTVVGFRPYFHAPALDLAVLLSSLGLEDARFRTALDDIMATSSRRRRQRQTAAAEEQLRGRYLLVPLLQVDRCWAAGPGAAALAGLLARIDIHLVRRRAVSR